MPFILVHKVGRYYAGIDQRWGSGSKYCDDVNEAKIFETREDAEMERDNVYAHPQFLDVVEVQIKEAS